MAEENLKRAAYEAARDKLMHLIDNPDKSVPVADYIAQLDVAKADVAAAYTALMED